MKYNGPFDQTNPAAGYVNGNPATNTAGSIPCAEGLEYPQREIVYAITSAGLTPTNSDLTQLWQAIKVAVRSVLSALSITGYRTVSFSTAGGTPWPVPAGVTQIAVPDCIGGGGGGGGANSTSAAGSAGGGGGNAKDGVYTVTPGEVLTIVVGAGGAPGQGGSSPTNGGAGGTSYIQRADGTVLCSASGGGGGFQGTNGVQTTSRGVGGAGVGGARNYAGAGGGFPIAITSTLIIGGIGGPAGAGAPQPQLNASNAGLDGFSRGGGANGSAANAPGGTGGVGEVTIRY